MSLKINGRTFNSLPLRFRGGAGFEYAESNKASQRNLFAGEGITDKASGNPAGHLYPSAWLWPQKSGSITAFTGTEGTSTATSTLAAGLGIDTSISGTSDSLAGLVGIGLIETSSNGTSVSLATWSASAIAEASSSGTASVTGTAIILAVAFADGASSGSATVSGSIGALLFNTATSSGTSAASANIVAQAFLAGSVTPFTELSPQNLAAAVWAAQTAQSNISGTMGKELINKLKKSDFLALKD